MFRTRDDDIRDAAAEAGRLRHSPGQLRRPSLASARMEAPRRTDRGVAALAGLDLAAHLALAGRYGFHRDELYLLACGRRLAWGSLDHAPLAPAPSRPPGPLARARPPRAP